MNLYNVKNIKDLPQLEQILPGNYLVVENFTGTNKLDFDDFVIGPRNTSFANQVFNDISTLSSVSISQSTFLSALSSDFEATKITNNTTSTSLSSLSSRVEMYQREFVQRGTINLPPNVDAIGFDITFNYLVNVTNPDVLVVPQTTNRLLHPPSFTYVYGITGKTYLPPDSTTIRIALSTGNINIGNNRTFEYKVIAYEYF